MQISTFRGVVLTALLGSASMAYAGDAVPASAEGAAASASAPDAPPAGPSEEEILAAHPAEFASFCLYANTPPSDYRFSVVRKLKVGKQTYGSVKDVLPELVEKARFLGANAIVNYNGSQRFGFLPWRMVRPVVTGTAVKWTGAAPDCAANGGATVEQVLKTNQPPAR